MANVRHKIGDRLRAVLPDHEDRPAQEAMAEAVEGLLDSSGVLLVEAWTGTGKSLAYLLPALDRAARTGGRLMVSTHTLNLQAQLLRKDLPLAERALGLNSDSAVAVGRANYLCKLRLDTAMDLSAPDLFGGRHAYFTRLEAWAQKGGGLREDAPAAPDPEAWESVQVEAYGCLGGACPHARACRFLKDREALAAARVVVANHALLMADVSARREGSAVLPDADVLVLDEAHHVPGAAVEHLGLRLSRLGVWKALDRILDPRRRLNLVDRLDGGAQLDGGVRACREAADALFGRAAALADRSLDLPPGCLDDPLSAPLADLAAELRRCAALTKELPQGLGPATEAGALAQRLDNASMGLKSWLSQQGPEGAHWVEMERGAAVLRSAPVDAGPLLAEHLYPRHHAVVLASATLTVGGGFAFMRRRLGLPDGVRELALEPVFDYGSRVEIHLTQEGSSDQEAPDYLDGLERGVRAALDRSQGRAFVLGTRFDHLAELARRLRPEIEARGWLCLEQRRGGDREAMLAEFKSHGRAVLFGAASFWEGVDVPGEALSCVIVTRLPFGVPDTPLERARKRRVEADGGDAFRDLSLPEAVLRLKQGFGRLIRHGSDRGWFVLLDPRVLNRSYGRAFLASLPPCPVFVDGRPRARKT